jgi:hypothetical protein
MFKLTDSGPALTAAEISAFEDEFGGCLPSDYKAFLLQFNGGFPEPPVGFRWKDEFIEVGAFGELNPSADKGLRGRLARLRERNTDGFLTIAWSVSRDIYLDFHDQIGAIFLWTAYRYDDQGDEIAVFMERLADSFTQFVNGLVEISVPFCRIENLGKRGTPNNLAKYMAEGNDLNATGKNGFTVLCEAIKFDNLPVLRACMERGASLSRSIYVAVQNRRPDLIPMLVEAGADVNERDRYGDTPLQYVGGTALPGEEGARNRELQDILIRLGAVK